MRILRLVLARCRALVRHDVVAGEIRDEMQFHLQMRAEEYERQGLAAHEARRAASRRVAPRGTSVFRPAGSNRTRQVSCFRSVIDSPLSF